MITFWVGMVILSMLFGDVFSAFNPWRAIGRATGAVVGRRAPAAGAPIRSGWAVGRPPSGLLMFTWIELVGGWADYPRTLSRPSSATRS